MANDRDQNLDKQSDRPINNDKLTSTYGEMSGHDEERDALRKARESEHSNFDNDGGEAANANLHFGDSQSGGNILGSAPDSHAGETIAAELAADESSLSRHDGGQHGGGHDSEHDASGAQQFSTQQVNVSDTELVAPGDAKRNDDTRVNEIRPDDLSTLDVQAHVSPTGTRNPTPNNPDLNVERTIVDEPRPEDPESGEEDDNTEFTTVNDAPDKDTTPSTKEGEDTDDTPVEKVVDTNEAPTDIALSNDNVAENDAGAVVATLTASDPDAGDSATFTLSDDASGLFEVVGNELKLKEGVSLDHEGRDSYEMMTLQVEDASGATYAETVTINVADVNEAPVDLILTPGAAPTTLSLNQDGGNNDVAVASNIDGFPTDALTVEV
ncbi:MAG: cadherin repeat domain-containing protein, partial [Alphaproteobacteria bacterium]|nr:cadherin repeat domain-containing protein [Alphaproteobacteria bacterium]